MPKVSVIIPSFNGQQYLKDAIDSVLGQTFQDYEFIVVDHGSQDGTAAIVKVYGDRIRYFFKVNEGKGPPEAMNFGIRQARGEYIAILGDDDIWLPEMLEYSVRALDKNPKAAFVCSETNFINDQGQVTYQWRRHSHKKNSFEDLLEGNFIHHLSVLMRRNILHELGGYDEELYCTHDYDLWLRTSLKYPFICLDEVLSHYRFHAANVTRNLDRYLQDHVAIFKKKEIIRHVPFYRTWICLAKVYYRFAEFKYARIHEHRKASCCLLKAVTLCPFIGTYFFPPGTEKFRFTWPYRLLKVYFLIVYYFLKSLAHNRERKYA